MTQMEQDPHIYLLLQYYSLFAIPVRLYENKQLIFQKIPFFDAEDPVQLVLPKIMNDNREIGYCLDSNHFCYGFLTSGNRKIIVGPVSELEKTKQELRHIAFKLNYQNTEFLIAQMQAICIMHPDTLLQSLIFLNFCINKTMMEISDVRIKKEQQIGITTDFKEHTSFEKKDAFLSRSRSYVIDQEIARKIKAGDVEGLKQGANQVPSANPRNFAPHLLRHTKNFFIRLLAICCFVAVEAGVNSTEIAELEELYVLKCESLEDVERIKNLQYHMILDLAERVQTLHKRNPNHSPLVKNITDYIKENLTERITVSEIAKHLSKSRGYVTTEFKKITGMNLSDYISELKINEAKELIRYTNRSFIDISSYLGFSTQSHFIKVFKKITGKTPRAYRELSNLDEEEKRP